MKIEFELDSAKHSPEDVLKYFFNGDENVIADYIYFEKVRKYLWSILNIEKLSSEQCIAPSSENTEKM